MLNLEVRKESDRPLKLNY